MSTKKAEKSWPQWPAAMLWDLTRIKPYPKNEKTHPPEQVKLLAELLKLYGPDQPIVVDEDGEILKGHGRRLAARMAEMTTFPVIQRFGLSEADKTAMRISDNQVPLLGGWDRELVQAGIGQLRLAGYNISLLGFSDRELIQWSKPTARVLPDAMPKPVRNPFVRSGDLWKIGKHVLLCGDSTKAPDVAKVIAGRSATTVSDPPYGIGYEYGEHDDKKDGNAALVRAVFALAPAVKIWTPGKMNTARELIAHPEAKLLCWHKKFAQAGSGLGGASTWEPVLALGIKNGTLPDDYLPFPTDREASPIDASKMLRDEHPCPKPVALFEHLLVHLTSPDSVVFDPFNGSGTTMIAAERTGRVFAGIDIDPTYVELAIMRWQTFTGNVATLEGKAFDAVKASRKKRQPAKAGASRRGQPSRQAAAAVPK